MNGYSPIDNVSTLSLAQTAGNELFVAYLKMHGAMLPFEIIDRAARRLAELLYCFLRPLGCANIVHYLIFFACLSLIISINFFFFLVR